VHAGEACHGDLGMITSEDVVLAVSNSGETTEFMVLLPQLKWLKTPIIALCGKRESSLGYAADIYLDASVAEEACALGLAPTSSTTIALVLGDALAVALLESRGFTAVDFARTHPGGSIGKRLLLTVEDLMLVKDAIPIVSSQSSLKEALLEVTKKGLGITLVVNDQGAMVGVFTDGDLRRTIDQQFDLHNTKVGTIMSAGGKKILRTALATEAVCLMEQFNITTLAIVDAMDAPIGIIHLHHLIKAGVA
jgi:arabinose-5-phosphate isomerase